MVTHLSSRHDITHKLPKAGQKEDDDATVETHESPSTKSSWSVRWVEPREDSVDGITESTTPQKSLVGRHTEKSSFLPLITTPP